MENLILLKSLIDESNYPYFTDQYLVEQLAIAIANEKPITALARELCFIKAGIEEIKLGDIIIPSPKNHFLMLAMNLKNSMQTEGSSRNMVRADEQ